LAVVCATEEPVTPDGGRAFVGATLFDGTCSDPISNAVIAVRDGRIVAAGAADAVKIPARAERIDVSGKSVVPGLIDVWPR
jgi:imidazolonepropionase-like amidohydrolase